MAVKKKNTWWDLFKKFFLFLIVIQMVPAVFVMIKNSITEAVYPKPCVAVIDIQGMIMDSHRYVKQLHSLVARGDIKGLLLRINSPGGAPAPSQTIFSEILKLKAKMPVVAFIENTCASGSYLIACAANKIITPASAVVGSIGVFMVAPNVKALADDWKVNVQFVNAGKYKLVGSPFGELMTEDERAQRQELVDDMYEQFIDVVVDSRDVKRSEHEKWAEGKVFTGRQAFDLKMVDKIGDMSDAEAELGSLAGIEGEIKFVKSVKPSAFSKLFGADEESGDTPFASFVSTILADAFGKAMSKATSTM